MQKYLTVFLSFTSSDQSVYFIVEYHTISQYFYDRGSTVFSCFKKNFGHHFGIGINNPRKEFSSCPNYKFTRIKRWLKCALR